MFWNLFKRKPKPLSFFDKLVNLINTDIIEVYNGLTYFGERNTTDGSGEPLKFNTEKWFKIRIGHYISGLGDWSGGFDRVACAVAEVYVDCFSKVLHVCANQPYYNSPTKEADDKLYEKVKHEVDEIKSYLSSNDDVKLETRDWWLKGVLESICSMSFIGEANLWKHPVTIKKQTLEGD